MGGQGAQHRAARRWDHQPELSRGRRRRGLRAPDSRADRVPARHRSRHRARGEPPGGGGRRPPAVERAQQIAHAIEQALPDDAPVLCHNDLLNANFIDDGVTIRIVDWEYAGMGDRFFDFGNFAVNHQLSEPDELRLLAAYFGRVTAGQHARLRLMRLMSDFREAMWGVVQQAISELDFDFSAYAGKHFDRMLSGATDARVNDWLDQAAT